MTNRRIIFPKYPGVFGLIQRDVNYVVVDSAAPVVLPAAIPGDRWVCSTEANAVVLTLAPKPGEKLQFGRVLGGAGKTLVGDGLAYSVVYCECVSAGVWNCFDNSGVFTLTP